jgi:polar amino acid transport system permease protein/cystine transport system permease protein
VNGWAHFLALFPEILAALLRGAVATLAITLGGLSVGVVWGLAIAFLRRSRNRVVTALGGIYVEVFRCVPVLVQLFIIYFGLGQIGLRLQPLTAAILGFGLNGAAYLAEVYRSGIEAVPAGQAEAAAAIGMTHRQAMLWIVLPQALKIALPPIGNYGIGLLKDSSIAVAVAAPEMTYAANALINETYLSTQIYLLLAVIYIAMSLPLSHLVRRLERRFRRGQPA